MDERKQSFEFGRHGDKNRIRGWWNFVADAFEGIAKVVVVDKEATCDG